MYKEWHRCNNDDPNSEFGHFFANPVRITATGPPTISAILMAHKDFFEQVSTLLDKIKHDEVGELGQARWPDPCNFKLLPLCRAIVMILDELPHDYDAEGGYVYVDKVLPRQNLVRVLTGEEVSLSAPIGFDSIKAQSIPLARPDADESIKAIQVPLSTAISFIAQLHRREEAAFPDLKPSSIDRSLSPEECVPSPSAPSADEWADGALQAADEKRDRQCLPDMESDSKDQSGGTRGDISSIRARIIHSSLEVKQ